MMQEQEVMECKTACMVNLALLMHKQGDNTEAFTWCERALKYVPCPSSSILTICKLVLTNLQPLSMLLALTVSLHSYQRDDFLGCCMCLAAVKLQLYVCARSNSILPQPRGSS